ncbi:hypothetical protein RUM44_003485 [Polyplax serrata]|uniref:Cation/H+ exchanger transmembrane domain-containing protein n=1 Tax=Polyplax serrata TaxID=468196 RepID=A0ABR1AGJ7_POLSC
MATEVNPQEHTSPGSESDHQRPKVSLVGETVPAHLSPHQHFSRKPSINSEHSIDQHGPVRRKSILHNAAHHNYGYHVTEDDKHWNGDSNNERHYRSGSRNQSFCSEKSRAAEEDASLVNSWWYLFCVKCRQKENTKSWEPSHWQKICPYPFCMSYRQFARLFALVLVGFLLWGIVYCILGKTAAPGGQLFGLALLCICANLGGWLATVFTLPALVGMLAVGVLFQNVGFVHISEDYKEICSILRKIALVIILIRAGLDLDPRALRRLYISVMKLGLVPWIIECAIIATMTYFLLDLPWIWGFLLGSIIAAVSPAVIVPCLLRLRTKGYGIAKGIPTLIIAISGIDDAASVAIFGIIHGLMFSKESLVFNIIQGPVSVVMGFGFGIVWGFLMKFIPVKDDPFVIPLRVLLLFCGGIIAVLGSEEINFGGAGPLGCVTAAFVSFLFWSKQGWDVEDNPAATAFEIFWMIFEPILFGITGTEIRIDEMNGEDVKIGLLCLGAGILVRMVLTICIAFGDRLNMKEKVFAAFALMAKATVQAALGPVAVETVKHATNGTPEDKKRADFVLLVCILSIILTAPIGAIIISLLGPRLLTKTSQPSVASEWRRRSHRPSIRDISIIDEEDELENNSSEENRPTTLSEELEISDVRKSNSLTEVKAAGSDTQDGSKS